MSRRPSTTEDLQKVITSLEARLEELERTEADRQRMDDALGDREARFRTIVENAFDLITEVAADGRFTYVSSNYRALLGWEPAELMGTNAFALAHPDEVGRLETEFERVLSGGEARIEMRFRHKDGSYRLMECAGRTYRRGDGQLRLVSTSRDITDRKQAEAELREGYRLNRMLLDSLPCVAFLLRPSTREVVASNEAAAEVGAVPGTQCFATWGQQDKPCPWCLAPEACAAAEARSLEVEKQGVVYDIHWVPVSDDLYLHYAWDITEHRRIETTLCRMNEELRTSIDQMPIGYILWDPGFRVFEWNQAAERIFGYTSDEVIGKPAADFIVPEHARKEVESAIKSLKGGQVASYSEKDNNRHKDGRLISCQWHNTPLTDGDGHVFAILSMVEDVTERLRAKEERARIEERLQQVQKMEALGELSAQMAHDFNNLVATMTGQSERVLQALDNDHPARKGVEVIMQAGQEAGEITRSLMTFSRTLPSEKRRLDFCTVVCEIEDLVRHALPTRVRLVTHSSCEGSCCVRADPTQLHRVILNLALNARDAMPEGGTLTIDASSVPRVDGVTTRRCAGASSTCVRLSLTDTGVGIPPDVQSRIFEPFFTTKPRGEGTGLGLSVAHGIVKDLGGKIEVRSEVGAGTTMILFLPCSPPDDEDHASGPLPLGPCGTGQLILLAAHEPYLRGTIASALEFLGYTVLQADGRRAVREQLGENGGEIQLVILAADPTDCDGRDRLGAVRKEHEGIPVILLTGPATGNSACRDERTIVLEEPFDLPSLSKLVRQILLEAGAEETRP